MAADEFFKRWSRQKTEPAIEPQADAVPPAPVARPLPTLEDVAALTSDSDFSPFVAKGVDESIRRSAMKKLFSDPHFNVMDGLDIYIGDYNSFEPIPPEMLVLLDHAKGLLDPLSQFEKPLMQLIEKTVEPADAAEATEPIPIAAPSETDAAAPAPTEAAQALPDESPAAVPGSAAGKQDDPA
jgi:hypothetical protein